MGNEILLAEIKTDLDFIIIGIENSMKGYETNLEQTLRDLKEVVKKIKKGTGE